jgi:hypothetical protein
VRDAAKYFSKVGELEFEGVQYGAGSGRFGIEVVAQSDFQLAVLQPAARFAHAAALGQELQALGCVAPAAQAQDRGHARIIPAADMTVFDQGAQFAFAGDDVGEIEARKFVLAGTRTCQ